MLSKNFKPTFAIIFKINIREPVLVVKFIENIGDRGINYFIRTIDFVSFMIRSIFYIFNPFSYTKLSFNTLIRQLYLSSIDLLPLIIFLAFILGSALFSIAIMFALNYNLQNSIGTLVVPFIINEFAPLFTTFFLVFHYSLGLYSKVVQLKDKGPEVFSKVYVPKLISGLVSVPSISLIYATIMLISGYIVSYLYLNIDLETYRRLIVDAVMLENIFILLIKGLILGFISIIIPIYYAHKDDFDKIDSAQRIIKVIGSLFITIFFAEILFLLISY